MRDFLNKKNVTYKQKRKKILEKQKLSRFIPRELKSDCTYSICYLILTVQLKNTFLVNLYLGYLLFF